MSEYFINYLKNSIEHTTNFKYEVNIARSTFSDDLSVCVHNDHKVYYISIPGYMLTRSPLDITKYFFDEFEKLTYPVVVIEQEADYYAWLANRLNE